MNRYSTHLLIVAALALLAPAIASAQEAQAQDTQESQPAPVTRTVPDHNWLFDLRLGQNDVDDEGIFAVSDSNILSTLELGVGYDFAEWVPGLRGYFTYETLIKEGGVDRFNGAALLDWRRDRVMLVADYGREFYGFLRPSVRVGAGYSLQMIKAEFGNQPTEFGESHGFAAQGAGALEASWHIGFLGNFSVVLSAIGQLGYQLQTTASFDDLTFEDDAFDSDDPWTREGIALGSIDTDGVFWDLGVGVRVGF